MDIVIADTGSPGSRQIALNLVCFRVQIVQTTVFCSYPDISLCIFTKFTDGFTGDRSRLITGKIRLERFQVTGQIIHPVSNNNLGANETDLDLVGRLLLEKKNISSVLQSSVSGVPWHRLS